MSTQGVPLWSTTAASNSSADPAVNWAEGQAPSSVNDSARAMMASVAKWRDDLYGRTTGGTSTAYTVTTGSTYLTADAMSGAIFTIIPHTTSGASPTLAVDGLTAYAINQSTGVAIPTGALVSGTPYLVKYVHASTEFILLGAVGKNTLAALDIINGTSETSIATGDTLPIYDVSATANRRMLVSDFLKVINALSADSSPDRAADYVMTYDSSASAAKKVLLQDIPSKLPRGYIDGCTLSNGTDATNDINIAAGVCRDSTNAVDITVAAMTGKQLDANWAPGSAAGMRNSAAGIANGTYHIYAVAKADGTQDIYAHTSATVATVISALQAEPGGADYLYARRIGSILRESGSIVAFVQQGDHFDRVTPIRDVNYEQNPGTSAVTRTLSVPTGIQVEALVTLGIRYDGSAQAVYARVFAAHETDGVLGQSGINLAGGLYEDILSTGNTVATFFTNKRVRTNTSAQVKTRVGFISSTDVYLLLRTNGWIDSRLV